MTKLAVYVKYLGAYILLDPINHCGYIKRNERIGKIRPYVQQVRWTDCYLE